MTCDLCPRNCGVDRDIQQGFCQTGLNPVVAKACVHNWEEPPISGTRGSGTVFFAGCNLRCVFCQNHAISRGKVGRIVTPALLADVFFELADKGVHNINLVTPSHILPAVADAVGQAKKRGLTLPFVYNTNAYETVGALRRMDGLIDIYLPDLKYCDDEAARRYSDAPGYFDIATKAILEMVRQNSQAVFDDDGVMRRGLIIRHLVLPGRRKDAMRILDWIADHVPDAYVSLMAQYFPAYRAYEFQEINRRVTTFEYQSVVQYFTGLGLKNGFMQDAKSAVPDYVPDWDCVSNEE